MAAGWGFARNDVRFLNAFGLDVPPCQVILQHSNESLFWVIHLLRAMMEGGGGERNRPDLCVWARNGGSPEYQIGMRHEIRDALQHASWLQHERWEGHPGQVHPYSTKDPVVGASTGWKLDGEGCD